MNILKEVDPEGTNKRKARHLRQRRYVSEGSNSCWYADGYDKLKPYGFPIHGCIDGYSSRILWLKVTKSNLHAKVSAAYYVDTMKELGICPKLLQTDCEKCINGCITKQTAGISARSSLFFFSCKYKNWKLVVT